jgi:17beta-estradiol 17-dehydrogenase / 3beta-hydroxysteroid 3-dehydrogenase
MESHQSNHSLKNKTALITGASSGIGFATALRLAQAGAHVYATARRTDRLTQLATEAENATGNVRPLGCDLRDTAAIEKLFQGIENNGHGLDILVNNAGLGRAESLVSGSTEAWREMLEVNVLALAVCTREAVQNMQRHDRPGHVVHISSMAAHRVPGGGGMYSASKYAVRALTEGLRQELRACQSPIRVTAISPGFVETEFAQVFHGDPEASQRTYGRFKCLEAEDIAQAVLYAVSQPPHCQVHDILMRPTAQPA